MSQVDTLEDWAKRAAQELQEFCDDAQLAAGNPDGEDQLPGVRALLAEHSCIVRGLFTVMFAVESTTA